MRSDLLPSPTWCRCSRTTLTACIRHTASSWEAWRRPRRTKCRSSASCRWALACSRARSPITRAVWARHTSNTPPPRTVKKWARAVTPVDAHQDTDNAHGRSCGGVHKQQSATDLLLTTQKVMRPPQPRAATTSRHPPRCHQALHQGSQAPRQRGVRPPPSHAPHDARLSQRRQRYPCTPQGVGAGSPTCHRRRTARVQVVPHATNHGGLAHGFGTRVPRPATKGPHTSSGQPRRVSPLQQLPRSHAPRCAPTPPSEDPQGRP